MAKRAKQKVKSVGPRAAETISTAAPKLVDNVIPLHARSEGSRHQQAAVASATDPHAVTAPQAALGGSQVQAAAKAAPVSAPKPAAPPMADDHGLPPEEDDHPEMEKFFSSHPPSAPVHQESWSDLATGEHEPSHHRGRNQAMIWSLAILVLGVLLIGGFLIYNKVLMPTPQAPLGGRVSLPTPDLLKNAEILLNAPRPDQVQPVAQPSAPAPTEAVAPTEGQPTEVAAQPVDPSAAPVDPTAAAVDPTAAPVDPAAAPVAAAPNTDMAAYAALVLEARKQGFKRNAEATYLQALTIYAEGSDALSGLAMLYLNQGKNAAARDRARESVQADTRNAEGWIVLGAALGTLGDGAGARNAYSQCAAIEDPKYSAECRRMLR